MVNHKDETNEVSCKSIDFIILKLFRTIFAVERGPHAINILIIS